MTGEPVLTIVGNLAGDPELRFVSSGSAVANFTVASTPRTFDKNANEFKDGETLWMRCSIWREAAENVAESLHKGDRVVVTGRLISRSWEDKESGQKRTVMEMQVDEVGPSLRYASAKVTKAQRSGGQQQSYGGDLGDPWSTPPQGQPQQQQQGWNQGPQQQQGWGQAPQQQGPGQQQQGWGGPPPSEPPF